jgi:hypothetical protein
MPGSDLNRPILNDGDVEILKAHDSHDEIDDRETLANYVRALARMTIAVGQDNSYHMGDIQRMVGVANDLETGRYDVDEIHRWVDDLSLSDGVEYPDPREDSDDQPH